MGIPSTAATEERSDPRVFVVVAAYNESRNIEVVVNHLLQRYSSVVVVDDGSKDDTSRRLQQTRAFWLRHSFNRGQGAALQTGIEFALRKHADIIVTFDADGQHDPGDIEALVNPILKGACDVVLGSRFLGRAENIPFARLILLRLAVWFTRIVSRIRVTDAHNGLRAFSREAACSLRIHLDRMGHASEILDQIRERRWRFQEVPVTITYSPYSVAHGQSSWNALVIGFQILLRKLSK
jgi:glycosyltransferase involved in cell wall biosynthesis